MPEMRLSFNTRKALSVQIGEEAAREITDLLNELARRLEQVERTKVNVTAVAPPSTANLINALSPDRME